jgi:hypothetical protein
MLNIIAKNVKSKLTKKVQGKVSCHALGDNTIVCDIICNGNVYRYTEKYTSEEIAYGLSSKNIADHILHTYATQIKCKFFK